MVAGPGARPVRPGSDRGTDRGRAGRAAALVLTAPAAGAVRPGAHGAGRA
ncbi:MAG: hypothetical protein AVDCRST_MAG66-3529 [uncultured Pseudonocardia sp.]|uniref:Uncharacterized protein n=1 Tax=uncultured Pseudonocardia sp. TaxID=211455 RepID=A0A6J4Q9Q0_9PSEU|nr:MAG: hypothetical protein AVDCRST_MAG66-3529 [uncultured Pseudonocardia sp.]